MKQSIGIQLYSVRDITPSDMAVALQALAAMGYQTVEFAGFFGHSAEDIASMLAQNGLKASGTHTGLGAIEADTAGIIAYHKAIGCTNVIIPGHDLSNQEKIDDFVVRVNAIQPVLEQAGLTLSYHNHSHEFIPNADGSLIYDAIEQRTQMTLELDTFWAFNAGLDPIAKMEALGKRLHFIHIKDGIRGGEGKPLGQGEAPVSAVYAKAISMGVPMVVESETLNPDGMTEARICIDYLKSLE